MDESQFWAKLQFRVTRELGQMQDKHLRYLWCDGLDPTGVEGDWQGVWVVGRAWMLGDDDSVYEFRLRIGDPGSSCPVADWSALMPTEESTAWLSLDRLSKRVEIDPFAAIPDDEATRE
tara:strand:- start:28443 stop:28799 length:357 start_codon:yes stop_codon:yes gene_type:complete